jgi:hypothetical protein
MIAPPAYTLDVRLDPVRHEVRGGMVLRFTNDGDRPLPALWFQLYPNTFKPGSTYLREAGQRYNLDSFFPNGRDPGWIAVGRAAVDGAPVQPVEHDAFLEVPLARPLAPGATTSVSLGFTTRVPEVYDRFGRVGDQYSLAYFYPRLAARRDGGWDLTPRTTPLQEFHDQHADYDVEVALPEGYVAGGTGHVTERNPLRFHAHDVRAFALEASPRWRETSATQDGVTVHVLAGEDVDAPGILAQTQALIKFYGELVGPYPYQDLTIVSSDAVPLGGVELPQVVLNSHLLGRLDALPQGRLEAGYEALNAHEVAHQWFFGIIGNDEARDAWIDEGFASYMARRWLERPGGPEQGMEVRFGKELAWLNAYHPFSSLGEAQLKGALRQEWAGLAEAPAAPLVDLPLGQVVATYYNRAPAVIELLRQELGEAAFNSFLHGLYDELKFRDADTAAVQAVAERAAGRSLEPFFATWVRGAGAKLAQDRGGLPRLLRMTAPAAAAPVAANFNLDLASIRSAHRGVSVGIQEGKPVWSVGLGQALPGLGNYESRWAGSLAQRPEGYAGGLELGLAWQPRVGENPSLGLNVGGERRIFPADPTGYPAAAANVARADLLLETRRVLYGVRPAGGRYRLGVEGAPAVLDNAGSFVTPSVEAIQHLDLGWATTLSGRLYAGVTRGQRDPRDELRLEREGQFREVGLGSGESLLAANLELTAPLSGALTPPGLPLPFLPTALAFANMGWVGVPVAELGLGVRLGLFPVGQASAGLDWAPYNTLEGFTPGVVQLKVGYGF